MSRNLTKCIVCGDSQIKPLYYPPNSPGPLARCTICGFVFVEQVENGKSIIDHGPAYTVQEKLLTSTDRSELADCWEITHLPAKLAEMPALHENALIALRHVAEFRQPPGRLLDFGCGWGFFLGAAKELGWSIYGLEPLPGHAIYARSEFEASVTTDILRDHTFPPEYFDAITAFQVFEHLPDPAGDLRILRRILRPEGVILIEVPNINTWSVRLLRKHHRHFVADHLNFFSTSTLSLLLEKQRFKILKTYHPTRRMTIRHFSTAWGRKLLPGKLATLLPSGLERSTVWDRIFGLNLGDIIAVLAQRID